MFESIGWVATGVFALSYVAKSPVTLRRVQAAAALLWIAYGIAMKAAPVIVANVVVAAVALLSSSSRAESPAAKKPAV